MFLCETDFTAAFVAVPEYEEENYYSMLAYCSAIVKGNSGLPKSARESKTFVPMNAGQRSFNAFIIVFNKETTAPGFATKSFRLVGLRKLFAVFVNPLLLELVPALPPLPKACASVATASNSGARFLVNLSGNCVTNFCRKEGRWS